MELKRGINLGGFLSQCVHDDAHYDSFIHESDIETIAGWGLDHVRLPIDYEVLEDEAGNIKPQGYERVMKVVEWCKKNGLNIILDLHKAAGYSFTTTGIEGQNSLFDDANLQDRFINLWSTISKTFHSCDNVAYELLNEVVEVENAKAWNVLISKAVKAIRVYSPTTTIIYGGIMWNSVSSIKLLEKPADENTILTFHFYEPLLFTHQKAHWIKEIRQDREVKYPMTMEYFINESKLIGYQASGVLDSKALTMGPEFIQEKIQQAIDGAEMLGAKLYCGEFGVIDQAPVEASLKWYQDVNEVFEKFNIGCAAWTYKKMDFGITDEHYDSIRDELIGLWTKK
ncbi:MAG: glycoside hydrolase family 5 protein [Clostridia bacterium]|nr:glycoside hydrolase family 5 protein [Clostridia bacterium]